MKLNLRWQILLAAVCMGLVFALLSFEAQTSSGLCSVSVPANGGVFVEGVLGAPQTLNPVLADNLPVDQELNSLLFDGLTRYGSTGLLEPALAESWSVSEDGLTVTFRLKPDEVWHDGEAVTAADAAFYLRPAASRGLSRTNGRPHHVAVGGHRGHRRSDTHLHPARTLCPLLDATTRAFYPPTCWLGKRPFPCKPPLQQSAHRHWPFSGRWDGGLAGERPFTPAARPHRLARRQ
ncbi:MAG: ABC transporter substrate-binding protein [Chloroflexi bacterium]|nr:ABC transporter substrate-binding protein [Chloroflexota bacterium]